VLRNNPLMDAARVAPVPIQAPAQVLSLELS